MNSFGAWGGTWASRVPWHAIVAWLPVLLILGSLVCVFGYHAALDTTIGKLRVLETYSGLSQDQILTNAATDNLDNGATLALIYLGIFVCAEAAFILMALREYLQDLVGLSEAQLIQGPRSLQAEVPPLDAVLRGSAAQQAASADEPES